MNSVVISYLDPGLVFWNGQRHATTSTCVLSGSTQNNEVEDHNLIRLMDAEVREAYYA